MRRADAEARAAAPRFVLIRSAGSLFKVYDLQLDAVACDHRRFQPQAAKAEADRLNAAAEAAR